MPSDGSNRPGYPEEPFLRRWSRRKRAVERPGPPDAPATPPAAEDPPVDRDTPGEDTPAPEPAAPATASASADEALPDPDTLDRESDFSAYLSERVSGRLRRAAMRRLFSLPEFNVRDGLDDYDEDYTQFQSLGDTVTAHMQYHRERLRRRDEEAAAAGEGPPAEGDGERPDRAMTTEGGAERAAPPADAPVSDTPTTAADPARREDEQDDDDCT